MPERPPRATSRDDAGWKFRTKVLDADLEITPPVPGGLAIVMQDEFRNTFEGCGYDEACTYSRKGHP